MIDVRDLYFTYDKNAPVILDGVSFSVSPGDRLAILGVNGAGKSTLLKCLNLIHKADGGQIFLDDQEIRKIHRRELAKKIAYVPQVTLTGNTMVFDYVLLGRKPHIQWDITKEDKQIVADILEKFDLTQFAARHINELSGGELQRVVLARAMAQQPQYLLLDEPTSNLDPRNQHEMLKTVQDIAQEQNVGLVVVIHDLNLAARYCNRFLFIKDGKVYLSGGQEVLTPENIYEVYGMDVDILEHKGNKVIVAV
jgi:iron complex transport system ATP-binding protein